MFAHSDPYSMLVYCLCLAPIAVALGLIIVGTWKYVTSGRRLRKLKEQREREFRHNFNLDNRRRHKPKPTLRRRRRKPAKG